LQHGYNYAKSFSNLASTGDVSSLLNNHNSEAGRLVSEPIRNSFATKITFNLNGFLIKEAQIILIDHGFV